MTAYFIVYSILAFFSLLEQIRYPKILHITIFFICATLLVFFAGMRNAGVGLDDFAYVYKFLDVPSLDKWVSGDFDYSFANTWMEPGYIIFGAFIKMFAEDYGYLFLAVALFSVGIASYNYYQRTPYAVLALLLFYVHTYLYRDLNQIRASLAAAIGLFLIPQIGNRKHIKAILTILFSGLFHMASLSYFFVYIISFIRITRMRAIYIYLASVVLGGIGITQLILGALPNFGYITVKLTNYASSEYAEQLSLFDITNIKNSFVFFLLLYFWNDLVKKVRYFEVMMLFYTMAVAWRITFNDFGILAGRVSTFFGIVEVLLIPSLVFLFKNKIVPVLVILIYAFLVLYLNVSIKGISGYYEINREFLGWF